jgi:hypothetical protein
VKLQQKILVDAKKKSANLLQEGKALEQKNSPLVSGMLTAGPIKMI